MEQFINKVIQGDCLEVMRQIPSESVDLVLTDPPYGTTQCKWDKIIDFNLMWKELSRVIKDSGAIVMTASQPYTSKLIMSNMANFKYCWVWNKKLAGNGILARVQPLKIHEDVCVFAKNKAPYYPQMTKGKARFKGGIKDKHGTFSNAESKKVWSDKYYPVSILEFSGAGIRKNRTHPTQKPVELMAYLIKTYTQEDDIILDPFAGSCTTAVAAKELNRKFICIEREGEYTKICDARLSAVQPLLL